MGTPIAPIIKSTLAKSNALGSIGSTINTTRQSQQPPQPLLTGLMQTGNMQNSGLSAIVQLLKAQQQLNSYTAGIGKGIGKGVRMQSANNNAIFLR